MTPLAEERFCNGKQCRERRQRLEVYTVSTSGGLVTVGLCPECDRIRCQNKDCKRATGPFFASSIVTKCEHCGARLGKP